MTPEREQLILRNAGLVRSAMIKLNYMGMNIADELESEGMLALTRAAIRYDERRGTFKFYANVLIKGALVDYLRKYYGEGKKRKRFAETAKLLGSSMYYSKPKPKWKSVQSHLDISSFKKNMLAEYGVIF